MNVLILTGKLGLGHYSAANALAEEIKIAPDIQVYIKDIFKHCLKKKSDALYGSFSFMVKRGRRIYNLVYKFTEKRNKNTKLLFRRQFIQSLDQMIQETEADIVISTLTFCSKVASMYKRETKDKIPLITCITDFTSHNEWLYPETDLYLTAAPLVRNFLLQKGVPEDHILVYGIPVRQQFKSASKRENCQEKRLLIMGGGLGLIPKSRAFYKKLDGLPNIKTTVITGNNKLLYRVLKSKYSNTIFLGYVNDVYRYMFQADAILSKPGGITTFEAIYAERPLLMFHPLLEQEIRNEEFVIENKLGIELSKKPDVAISQIQYIIQNSDLLENIKSNMRYLKSSLDEGTLVKVLMRYKNEGVLL